MQILQRTNVQFAIATLFGLVAGYLNIAEINSIASGCSEIFINLLKLVSLPILFLSIVTTACNMESVHEIKHLGKRVITYTFMTTIFAAALALALYAVINPVQSIVPAEHMVDQLESDKPGYVNYLLQIVPSNIVKPFYENHVIGVLFIAMLLSFSILSLPDHHRATLKSVFSALYAAIMKITIWIVKLMPIAVSAFLILFIRDLQEGLELKSLALYLTCVIAANLIQGLVVLPALLKWKGVSPTKLASAMGPALSVAFFTKSSAATLPMAMRCAEERAGISKKVAGFTLPLCTTINMNGCAAFILITVLFVSMSHGMVYTPLEMVTWILIATVAAVGNAGVPMGCYFLASAFLAAMNVPLHILGIILPFYTIIDMIETALNVWSDSCVAAIVDHEALAEPALKEDLSHLPAVDPQLPKMSRCC